jgi:acetylornithine deacetylase/succinyl-diaminopimelate desuccinylase-like protein
MDVELAARLVHSADERIAIDDLELGVDAFRHVVMSLVE